MDDKYKLRTFEVTLSLERRMDTSKPYETCEYLRMTRGDGLSIAVQPNELNDELWEEIRVWAQDAQ